jgi:hypothetical protein
LFYNKDQKELHIYENRQYRHQVPDLR